MSLLSQIFPPRPTFTEKELADQTGRVVIVTGAASGVGLELAKILYGKNATIYIGVRSVKRGEGAMRTIKAAHPSSKGRLEMLVLDLADLPTIKPAVQGFLRKENKLHVLVHNAGVMTPPAGSKSVQGYDLEMGTNCLGPFLLTKLLEPLLRSTARAETETSASKRDVRLVWVSSLLSVGVPKGSIVFGESGAPKALPKSMENYMQSKAGIVFLATEFAKSLRDDGVLSVSLHPGLMRTELQRHMTAFERGMMGTIFKSPVYGAYTELFAGFSPEVNASDNGGFFIPWGRRGCIPENMKPAMKSVAEKGTGVGKKFYGWCDSETRTFR